MKFFAVLLLASLPAAAQASQQAFPQVDAILNDAVQTGLIPGAVVAIGYNGQVVYRNAYGWETLIPRREPMEMDTIFDAASLTKVIATTPSVMKLFEAGKIRIDDPVTKYLPEFQDGKSDITIRLLMTHFSGLPPDLDLQPRWSGYETGVQKALHAKPIAPPGARFMYSDINFILMGEIVRRLSGESLAQFAHEQIFAPLGMNDTGFLPSPSLRHAHRCNRNRSRYRPALSGCCTRSHIALHGRYRRSRGSLHYRRRPRPLRRNAAGQRHAQWGSHLRSAYGQEIHRARKPSRSTYPSRARLGHRFALFE